MAPKKRTPANPVENKFALEPAENVNSQLLLELHEATQVIRGNGIFDGALNADPIGISAGAQKHLAGHKASN